MKMMHVYKHYTNFLHASHYNNLPGLIKTQQEAL